MAVTKYMNRIIAASEVEAGYEERHRSKNQAAMHDQTYGICSDPLTQFACVFAALIHDVDHPGITNQQLVKENPPLATVYKGRSVAEQKSFDMSWDLFLDPCFDLLRSTLCPNGTDLTRFRQLVINCVMATDLNDNDLKALRNDRWSKAFDGVKTEDSTNRKATIVIEHLIQAAVSLTRKDSILAIACAC